MVGRTRLGTLARAVNDIHSICGALRQKSRSHPIRQTYETFTCNG